MVTNEYNEALRPTGLRTTQLAVLVAIGAGKRQSLTDIAELLMMDISTLTRSIAILEEKGLATCQAAGGRKKHVMLTPDGVATVFEAHEHWNRAQQGFCERMGDELYNALFSTLSSYLQSENATQGFSEKRSTPQTAF